MLERTATGVALRTLLGGSAGALVSTAVIGALSARRTGHAASGTNAASHWIWPLRGLMQYRTSLRYTGTGWTIHHLSSIWWAAFYETWLHVRPRHAGAKALAIALAAYAVDYHVVPRRLRPGFEHHVPRAGFVPIYGAFALGLYAARRLVDHVAASARRQRRCSSSIGSTAQTKPLASTASTTLDGSAGSRRRGSQSASA